MGQQYEVSFSSMQQKNLRTGKPREIRPPYKWKQPEKPIVDPGPTFCIKVPAGAPGTCIQVPHPKDKSQFISVNVPASAKVGACAAPGGVAISTGSSTGSTIRGEERLEHRC